MKTLKSIKTIVNLVSLFIFLGNFNATAQVNETPNAYYDWGKKKTDFQDGYVILKSGDKMEGKISLIGSRKRISKVKLRKQNGKTIKLSKESVKAYGLNFAGLVNDSDESRYKWNSGATVMGHSVDGTKPMPGYVILANGTKVKGIMKLKRRDGMIHKIKITKGNQKLTFEANNVAHYGIEQTIASITKDGTVVHTAAGMNFNSGELVLKSGEKRKGLFAFRGAVKTHSTAEADYFYRKGVYFAANQDTIVEYYKSSDIASAEQIIRGKRVAYQSLEKEFIKVGSWEKLVLKNKKDELQEGTVILRSGEVLEGKVAQAKGKKLHSNYIYYQANDGILKYYKYPELLSYTQKLNGQETTYVETDGVYVESQFEGGKFILYRNPFPTTKNKFLTGLIDFTVSASMMAAANHVSKKAAKSGGYAKSDINKKITKASYAELEQMDRELNSLRGSLGKDGLSKQARKNLGKQQIAIQLAKNSKRVGANGNHIATIMKKEWIILNKETGEEIILVKSDYKKIIKPHLEGCARFLNMSKRQQKALLSWDRLELAIQLMDKCY